MPPRDIVTEYAFPKEEALLSELLGLLAAEGCAVEDRSADRTVRPHDVLFVIDMQTDFLPGGPFGVAEGNSTLPEISRLMCDVFGPTNLCFVTRDYHPIDHCSFQSYGGPFPVHCVQGSEGSHLHPIIADAVRARGRDCTSVVFKGFSEDIDSYGALAYCEASADARLCQNPAGMACSSTWTGSFVLKCSNMDADVNAPPDFTAVLYRKDVIDVIKERTASAAGASSSAAAASASAASDLPDAYICGLAFDFCVLDTAINGRKSGAFRNIYIVANAARASHIPTVGRHGSGFLSCPKEVAAKLAEANVKLILF